MKARFGKHSGGISFFAFQDIITGTTGLMIILMLFLALDLVPSTPQSGPEAKGAEPLAGVLKEVDMLKKKLSALDQSPLENEAAIKHQIQQLDKTVAQLQLNTSTPKGPDPKAELDREVRIQRQAIMTAKDDLLAATEAETKRARAVFESLPALEQKIKDAESSLAQKQDLRNVLRLIPDRTQSVKEPIIVLVQASRIRLQTFQGTPPKDAFSIPDFVQSLKPYSPSTHYLVFYFKPTGVTFFDGLTAQARKSGYEIGYDLVPEKIEIEFTAAPR